VTDVSTEGVQDLRQDAQPVILDDTLVNSRGDEARSADCNYQAEAPARPPCGHLELPEPATDDAAERQLKTEKCTSSPTAGTSRCTAEEAAARLGDQPTTRARSPCTRG
jgi:hypothetical protein